MSVHNTLTGKHILSETVDSLPHISVLRGENSDVCLLGILKGHCCECFYYLGLVVTKPVFGDDKGADQPAHPHRLISTFVIRLLESVISKLASNEISIF